MKKILIKLLSVGMSLVLIGCQSEQPEPAVINADTITEITQTIGDAFVAGDYAAMRSYFSSELKSTLSQDKLKESMDGINSSYGTPKISSIEPIENKEMNAGYVYLDYDTTKLKLFLKYDEYLKVTQIFINQMPTEPTVTSNDVFTEQVIKIGPAPQVYGVLTLPVGVENPPIAILVPGSGPQNYNEEITGNLPFEDWAHGLASQGIASIRYDKRYFEYPEIAGDNLSATVDEEYMYDIAYAVHHAQDYPVDASRIIYIGHSQGAMLAYASASQNFEITDMVLLGGPAQEFIDVSYIQSKRLLPLQGVTQEQVDAQLALVEDAREKVAGLTEDSEPSMILGLGSGYWFQMNAYQSKNFIDKVTIPTLILQGEDDAQVYFDVETPLWEEYTKDKDNVTMKSYPGLNHYFMHADIQPNADYSTPDHVDEEVIQDVADWIHGEDITKDSEDKKEK